MMTMSNHINPLSTQCVLKFMGLAIDEIKLIRSIDLIFEQMKNTNAEHFSSGRTLYLVTELRYLTKRLRSVRDKARREQTED
jgi:hypothetical protein